ncbi:Microcystin-dependent protein [Dyadobacter soli]|uniref:Microcystin-dependent protein n=2 Tax=Dyadobacter soli TaxID=659014 RepID=A0A1G7VW96_9BACT|nr:Microcystin-dependent protein [Dyadobacter soli]
MFAYPGDVKYWVPCDGRALEISKNQALFDLIGRAFGGDGAHFNVPDLRNRVLIGNGPDYPMFARGGEETHSLTVQEMPKHHHQALASTNPSNVVSPQDNYWASDAGYVTQANATMNDQTLDMVGYGMPHSNMSPYLAVNYAICVAGIYPAKGFEFDDYMGMIKILAGKWDSDRTVPCDGRLLPVSGNAPLFALLRNTYGGDDVTTFALPDLRGKAAVGCDYVSGAIPPQKDDEGSTTKLTPYQLGKVAGAATVKLTVAEMPKHYHPAHARNRGNLKSPLGQMWANQDSRPPVPCFANDKGAGAVMSPSAIGDAGGDQPHNNMMPYQAIGYVMSLGGVYPSRP